MPERPLLLLPEPLLGPRIKGGRRNFPRPVVPDPDRQDARLQPRFQRLETALARRRAELRVGAVGLEPDLALVLETVGPVDRFARAVQRIDGLEWLGDIGVDLEQDEDFRIEDDPDKALNGHLYLVMTDAVALQQLRSLWERVKAGEKLERGFGAWSAAFRLLRDVRPWNDQDRVRETGFLDDWREGLARGDERLLFEAELWFRGRQDLRAAAGQRVTQLVADLGGRVLGEASIPEIRWHALRAELRRDAVSRVLENQDVRLLAADDVMFLRPRGQMAWRTPPNATGEPLADVPVALRPNDVPPVLALLDGLPLENHRLLAGGLRIDDPDGVAGGGYPAAARLHGTAMASLLLRGDLSANAAQPLSRPVYVRPVLQAIEVRDGEWDESTREDEFVEDVVYRAVVRMFGAGEATGVAPSVKIVNLSLGDRKRCFDGQVMSAWARLLDFLAYRYNVLFVVSAGNHDANVSLADVTFEQVRDDPELRRRATLRAMRDTRAVRRLRNPAESLNALTVGASHEDATRLAAAPVGDRLDLLSMPGLASPTSACGSGVRRSVKPEVLAAGGRMLHSRRLGEPLVFAERSSDFPRQPPGVRVAWPGPAGGLEDAAFVWGTSPAATAVSRSGAELVDVLDDVRQASRVRALPDDYYPVLLKTLLVHSARWGDGAGEIAAALAPNGTDSDRRRVAAQFLGYGVTDQRRVVEGGERRATLLGWGRLANDQAHLYRLPLPNDLSALRGIRRLVITLAWFSPVTFESNRYRCAQLSFRPPGASGSPNPLRVNRAEVSDKEVVRGTVQHEILEGEQASPFAANSDLQIPVSCRVEAGRLAEPVRYGLAVTLEVGQDVRVDVYESIRARLRARVAVQPQQP